MWPRRSRIGRGAAAIKPEKKGGWAGKDLAPRWSRISSKNHLGRGRAPDRSVDSDQNYPVKLVKLETISAPIHTICLIFCMRPWNLVLSTFVKDAFCRVNAVRRDIGNFYPKNDPKIRFFGLFSFWRNFGAMVVRSFLEMRTEGDLLEKTVCDYLFPVLRKSQKTRF